MDTKYLILRFDDASYFLRGRDRYNDDKLGPKISGQKFEEPITIYHISNMLHVLFSERPVPTVRKVEIHPEVKVMNYYFQKAGESYIHIQSVPFKNKKGDQYYQREIVQTKKNKYNSWNPEGPAFNWFRLQAYLGQEYYGEFRDLCSEELGLDDNVSLKEVVRELDLGIQPKMKAFFKKMKENGKTMLYRSFFQTQDSFNQIISPGNSEVFDLYGVNVLNGIAYKTSLNGYIYVPVSDEDIDKLSNGKGVATLLDGGLVTIEGLGTEDDLHYDCISVGELSRELIKEKSKS